MKDKWQRRRNLIAAFLALLVCAGLFLPWGEARVGGSVRMGDMYSNPIWVDGTYPRGVAASLKEFSYELNGFQEQFELFGLVVTSILIFTGMLELIFSIFCVLRIRSSYYIGKIAQVQVLLLMACGIAAAYIFHKTDISIGEYIRIEADIRLNVVPFLVCIVEIIGKNVCLREKFD